ncbi:inclusion body family protein [Chitinophaga pinensis]|uniref:DNA-directed RNA polymerase subunit beta n=1 Tax=Chitinophaga pinensis TaxID=79329 RepID=A0A5C6LKA3_9BACT|nr:inclusion body family protein [Chitinophaga pinensis]TWV94347.1 DNA-directed RNA polymerase subunit beta [Chitinophaga pinensis]TWV97412.1 DNA-directed RNA polymerase subunit beta [Chitinophaga pinensis]
MSQTATATSRATQGNILDVNDQLVHVMFLVDTAYIYQNHQSQISTDPNNPMPIDHNSEVMACSFVNKPSKQGTADLSFSVPNQSTVAFWGSSLSNNGHDAIIIYGIERNTNLGPTGDVFNPFVMNKTLLPGGVIPSGSVNGLPATTESRNIYALTSTVKAKGTENFVIKFGLYLFDADTQTQKLWSYCQWDPTITVY